MWGRMWGGDRRRGREGLGDGSESRTWFGSILGSWG